MDGGWRVRILRAVLFGGRDGRSVELTVAVASKYADVREDGEVRWVRGYASYCPGSWARS